MDYSITNLKTSNVSDSHKSKMAVMLKQWKYNPDSKEVEALFKT